MQNYLFIFIVMKNEIRHTVKALPLLAISEWPRLMATYGCFRDVFKQHRRHYLPVKIYFQTYFLILLPPLWTRYLIWAMEHSKARPSYKACHRWEEHLPTPGAKVHGTTSHNQPQNLMVISVYQQQIQKEGNRCYHFPSSLRNAHE